jgi:BNR repeat-containing family member
MSNPIRPWRWLSLLALAAGCANVSPVNKVNPMPADQPNYVRGRPVVLNDNGAWCWFQNERAIYTNGQVLVGSIADDTGADGERRKGNVELATWDLKSGRVGRAVLHEQLEDDDHNAPALYVRQDGRLLAVYGKHGSDPLQRWRISQSPGDVLQFGPEQTLEHPVGYCYQNIYRLSAENGRLYNFHRGVGWNPNYNVSDDDGQTWRYGGRFISWPKPSNDSRYTGMDGGRPYPRYASDGVDSVHVCVTEDHPRAYDNSIYHGIVRSGQICASDGTPIAPLSTTADVGISPQQLTRVYEGGADHVAWTSDIRLDGTGRPVVAFTVQMNDGTVRTQSRVGGEDIRYYYATFDGKQWHPRQVAFGGHRLYSGEDDYSGLITLDPADPATVYFATSADPVAGTPLISSADGKRHYEIYRGTTRDAGRSWAFVSITANSTQDNLRPIIVPGTPKGTTALLWFRGMYRTYRDYQTEVVGVLDP